jgi:hypothetical protein
VLSREELFQRLQDTVEISALVNTTEHLHLECKTWSANENDAQRAIAKALCGFANADGGVLVIGLATARSDKYCPDLIERAVPVFDAVALRSRIESLVPELVEPGLEGVTVAAVREHPGSPSGFVLVDVPPTEGPPCRSRKDWRFYQRINSGTYLMEYFQIENMFGKRNRPQLSLYLEEGEIHQHNQIFERGLTIGIENQGRAVARFPSVRFKRAGINVNRYGIDGNGGFGLPLRPTEPELIVFGGGADHVVYPGTLLKIAVLDQRAKASDWNPAHGGRQTFYFEEYTLTAELSADEARSTVNSRTIARREIPR